MKQTKLVTFKLTEDFEKFLDKKANEKAMSRGAMIRAVLKKYLKYKEPELV